MLGDDAGDVAAQLFELPDRCVALVGKPLLERRVPLDRDSHQADEHVAEMNRLAAELACLRLVELGDQGADRGTARKRFNLRRTRPSAANPMCG